MDKISVIIPARNEPYLQKTIDSLLNSAGGDIEIIVVLDGWWPDPIIKDDQRVILIHNSESEGMRPSINAAARIAKGKYLMKCDAHCCFDKDFDIKLAGNCKYDWTIVPRRYGLDVDKWERTNKIYDFQYIEKNTLKGKNWTEYSKRVKGKRIADLMTSQGSCWFMHRQRFLDLGGLDEINYGSMGREAQEVCLKAWLSGGRYMLNRKTWYAHWSKPKEYVISNRSEKKKSVEFATDLWMNDKWPGQKRKLRWLVDRFSPVPSWVKEIDTSKYIQEKYGHCPKESHIKLDGVARIDMYKLFAELGFKVGAEIGVWEGRNALNIFDNIPGIKMFLVDPYKNYDYVRKARGENRIVNARRRAHRRMKGKNAQWLEMLSEEAIKEIPDGSLDFVYIDAEHDYDMPMLDIILWNRKIRKGGIVSGHDYYHDQRHKIRVRLAVDDYVKANGIRPVYITDKKADLPLEIKSQTRNSAFPSWFWVKT